MVVQSALGEALRADIEVPEINAEEVANLRATIASPDAFRTAGMEYNPGTNISVSLSGDDADDLRGYWDKLSDGGTVTVPFEKQMWGDEFGACFDRFGIPWMVNVVQG